MRGGRGISPETFCAFILCHLAELYAQHIVSISPSHATASVPKGHVLSEVVHLMLTTGSLATRSPGVNQKGKVDLGRPLLTMAHNVV